MIDDRSSGRTIIDGHVIEIGGTPPKAMLRLANNDLLCIRTSEEVVTRLGKLLYRHVVLELDGSSWQLAEVLEHERSRPS